VPLRYKFVEVGIVTDETLEACVNDWVAEGWTLEGIRFVMTEHSKRPAMAYVSFIREDGQEVVDANAPHTPPPKPKASANDDEESTFDPE
jgi:hypothetical protein